MLTHTLTHLLSFLNWLTAVPAIMCLDDAFLVGASSSSSVSAAATATVPLLRRVVSWSFGLLIARLSVPVVRNLLSKKQIMNGSFDPLRLVNTYGAFGTVTNVRNEIVLSSAQDLEGPWREYEFPVKPGSLTRSPRFVSPYHYRLDWQLWIAACFGPIERSPWIYHLMIKLLEQDPQVIGSLLANDPWQGEDNPPKYIRADLYRYSFHRAEKHEQDPPYWDRTFVTRYHPKRGIETLESLRARVE